MTFLKTVLIILLVYLGLKYLIRFTAPYLIRYIAKKATQKMEQAFNSNYQYQNNTKTNEGNVSIDKVPNNKSKRNKAVGDYVDYEEID
ncbi:MAG: DUF4834 domain-containing protein [Flavobacteriaceae bacterium CG_4_8_14_3_um_filter_34_10]|nr:DUF4834 family protein [Flavobacteriia bacterium]OIP52778.1 MAG: DUF4834 domain-containing protein [Flavobacteriaceae bacterium CG2_30_34_30]PIQ18742.1 MAG: DUF4834 domain-containing protein [Flavobacteriaceae bacterium CG18_big_fil_WC_8_21_14_2_50_34_36]PIV48352.1 MAG: DUF4834 domain-containing protein [Flavobacteriaceae bacterium CG02_land_8_20_14_3_00_34_13]PIX10390.1 MAG: DUF4834 domain-containing protein [Flavobacteriaceae bacterium CG_4_8_14_3_um_filter_34_10]PIZ08337.1 MAG: DUF4834 d